jgi:hypothetical protein
MPRHIELPFFKVSGVSTPCDQTLVPLRHADSGDPFSIARNCASSSRSAFSSGPIEEVRTLEKLVASINTTDRDVLGS